MIATAATKKVPAKTTRCAIYTRKSTEDGLEQEFNSLDAQRESGESYVASQKSMGWVALDERYDDGGYTGGNMDRPALERLLADIKAGKVDCVVVYKVDRLSRSLMDFARMMQVFDAHNVAFVSVTQHFDTSSSMGRLILNVLLSFAQFEREIISERIRDKKAATARKGKWCGGIPVLGYDVDRSTGSPRLAVNAAEAARVREIFGLYLKLGSLLPVIEELAQRGWRNKQWTSKGGKVMGGLPFNKTNVYCMLVNPVYIGKIVHKTDLYDGEHEPIIPRDTFQKVQSQLQYNGRTGGLEARNKYGALLRGLLFCKACGSAMTHSFVAKKNKRYRYYTCTHAIKSGYKICPSGSLPAAEIERVVVEQVRCVGQDEEVFHDVLRQAQVQADAELAALRAEQTDLENELARHHREIRRLAVKGPASSATTAQIADLHDKIAQAERRATELRDKLDVAERQRVCEDEVRAALGDFEGLWQTLTPKEQAKMLSTLIARVDYDVAESTVAVAFHPSGIKALSQNQLEEAVA